MWHAEQGPGVARSDARAQETTWRLLLEELRVCSPRETLPEMGWALATAPE